ncbi:P27 family phage terminase small subunit [Tersicoccus sp. Bi-70]|uniref:P27 family phage terminase small subunit n=1 Tax=Tersicoccus sp. Bi-70 TaxID=1897634 RepID=UPI000978996E|nr:P27 family phage terminase small subunit [Tersicoccus sp. Bi-70]OMH30642.1 hypothetical protein BGP79_11835 [Tersicoccus sp. Bi-70]
MPADVAGVWREIVASNDLAGRVDRAALEAFATLVARMREARDRVAEEGLIVEDSRGRTVPHPALLVERQTAEQIRAWGDRFAPLVKPVRRRGYMADATASAIAGAKHLQDESGKKFAGAVAAAKTLAWLIDEAQRTSMDALMKASSTSGIVPSYLKVCAELQITPASVADAVGATGKGKPKSGGTGGRRGHLQAMQGGAVGVAGASTGA